jgi:hypothetical protein
MERGESESNIADFETYRRRKKGGGGPEDPMLEQRVGTLEQKVDRIEAILTRLEPKIGELLKSSEKQSADLNKLHLNSSVSSRRSQRKTICIKRKSTLPKLKGASQVSPHGGCCSLRSSQHGARDS